MLVDVLIQVYHCLNHWQGRRKQCQICILLNFDRYLLTVRVFSNETFSRVIIFDAQVLVDLNVGYRVTKV